MYHLELSATERQAFDWVGHRYAAGEISDLLAECLPADAAWADEATIAFTIPESTAWSIYELAEQEDFAWPCFASGLAHKLNQFCFSIV